MPRDSFCTSSHLDLQWARQSEIHLGKTRTRVHLILKTEISHTARLISISAAHSLLQFKSANSGLHCLFSAAYTMHQICLLGTRYYLQEYVPQRYVCSHPLPEQAKTTQYHVFPALCRGTLCHVPSLEYKDMPLLLRPTQSSQMVISLQTGSIHPSAALHWRNRQQTVPSLSPLLTSVHSEMHVFTLLSLSPQLIGWQEKIQATWQQVQYRTICWVTYTTSFYKG